MRAYREAMTNNNFAPIPPLVPRDDDDLDKATIERDDEIVLDPDANDDLVDSAEADRLASDPEEADDRI